MTKHSEKVKEWRRNTKKKTVLAMGGKCQCCGYDTCYEALELHHLDPNVKDLTFSKIRANPKNVLSMKEELKKCILVCANCHREIHWGVRSLPETFSKLDEEIFLSKKKRCKGCKKYYLDLHYSEFCGNECKGRHNANIRYEN